MKPPILKSIHIPANLLTCCGIIAVLAAACYIRTLFFGFLIIDDPVYVTNNPSVLKGLVPASVKWAFTSFHAEFWHPLTWLSLMADASLYGSRAAGFHATSLLLHAASGIFLFLALDLMTEKRAGAFFIAAVFAVHPLHVEAVAWIAERKEVLCGFFWCAALFFYARYAKKTSLQNYLAVFALFSLGLMSKPMIVTFPFALLLLDFWPLKRLVSRRFFLLLVEKIPFFILSFLFTGLALYAQHAGQGIVGQDVYPMTARIANAFIAYKTYLLKAVIPADLSIFYPFRTDMPAPEVILSSSLIFLLLLFALIRLRKQPYLFTGLCWFLGTLVPVIGIIKIGDFSMADRYMYMPLTGLLLAGTWLAADILEKPRVPKSIPVILAAGLIAFYGAGTWNYLEKWKTNESLFMHAAAAAGPNYFAHFALGHVYAGKGRFPKAETHFRRAAALRPEKPKFSLDLGRAVGVQGRFSDAVPYFSKVLDKKEDCNEAHYLAGLALTGSGRLSSALDHLMHALEGKKTVKGEKKYSDLIVRLEKLRSKGQFREGLELIGIKGSEKSLSILMAKGFDEWEVCGLKEKSR